jgi:hypothetical protein
MYKFTVHFQCCVYSTYTVYGTSRRIHALGYASGKFGSLKMFYQNWCLTYLFIGVIPRRVTLISKSFIYQLMHNKVALKEY